MKTIRLIFCLFLLIPTFLHAEEITIKPLKADSIEAIKNQYKNQAFAMALWSIDCPPCYEELQLLGKWIKNNPEVKIVIISTDSAETKDDAKKLLAEFKLQQVEHWIFSDPNTARLRHSIDPKWFGELPRSYLFDKQHQAYSHSGILNEMLLDKWVELVTNNSSTK